MPASPQHQSTHARTKRSAALSPSHIPMQHTRTQTRTHTLCILHAAVDRFDRLAAHQRQERRLEELGGCIRDEGEGGEDRIERLRSDAELRVTRGALVVVVGETEQRVGMVVVVSDQAEEWCK